MTVNELIDRLVQLREDNFQELIVAVKDENGLYKVDAAKIEQSVDGVGRFVLLEKKE